MKAPILEWERVKRPLMAVRAAAYLVGTLNMAFGSGGGGRIVAAILGIQVVYSLAAMWMPIKSIWPFAFADILTVSASAVLVGLEPTSVHLLLATDVLALSVVLDQRFVRASVALGFVAVAVIYLLHPWSPYVGVSSAAVDRAQFASGIVGLAVASLVLYTLVREVKRASGAQDARIVEERRKAEVQARFLAMVNHELRTPLTAIRGFASVLQDNISSSEAGELAEYVDAIAGQSEHLARVVEDVLVALKLDTGTMAAASESVDVSEVFEFVGRLVGHSGTRTIVFDRGDVTCVRADRDRLIQVLRNLIDNAVKYGGDHIEVTARQSGDTVELVVADDGPGIPNDKIDQVFGDYVQLAGSSTITDGLGLGLAICRRLVEAMDGSVSVVNRPEGGARFTVSLPAETPVNTALVQKSTAGRGASPAAR